MADLPWLRSQLLGRAHLVLPSYADTVIAVLSDRMGVQVQAAAPTPVAPRPARYAAMMEGGVLALPITGGLVHRGMNVAPSSGVPGAYTAIQNTLIAAMKDADVRAVLLDVDSPGGMAVGCFELCDALVELGRQKPIWAVANGMAASAAYAIASSAKRLTVTPSGEVGSIGVVVGHVDYSEAIKKEGLAVTFVYAGKHKIDGNPYQPLPASVKADLQAEIDARYEQFVSVVAARRPLTARAIRGTEARMFSAQEAVDLKLADAVATFDATLADLQREVGARRTVVTISPSGAAAVSQTNQPAAQPAATTRIEGLEDALASARKDGAAAARAEMAGEIVTAYERGRKDACAILSHEAAQGRLPQALIFAGNSKFAVDEATALLSVAPQASGSEFRQSLKANDPKVPAGNSQAGSGDADPVADYQAGVATFVRQRLGVKA
ncbi:MAG: S49 family peptidase [Hyphomicrobiaceae bacterium]